MKTTVKDSGAESHAGLQSLRNVSSPTTSLLMSLQQFSKNEGVVGKLLQTKPKYGLLVQVGVRYLQIWGGCYTPTQCLERNSSPIMVEALARVAFMDHTVDDFKLKSRLVCCDQAPSNVKAEQALQISRQGWCSCVLPYGVHITSACFQKTFDLLSKFLSGLLHTSCLALRNGPSMLQFRASVRLQIRQKFSLVLGPVPAEAQ